MLCGRLSTYNVELRWAEFEQWFVLAVYCRSWISTDEDGDLTQKENCHLCQFLLFGTDCKEKCRRNRYQNPLKKRFEKWYRFWKNLKPIPVATDFGMYFTAFSGRVFLGCPTAGSVRCDIEVPGGRLRQTVLRDIRGLRKPGSLLLQHGCAWQIVCDSVWKL